MTKTRYFWALMALALTLVLAACSTPEDLKSGGLEAQFGTAEDDIGVDVATNATGRIYTLSTEAGLTYEQDENGESYEEGSYNRFILRRSDASGNTTWTKEVIRYTCNHYAYECESGNAISVSLDPSGNVYVLHTSSYTYYNGYDPTFTSYLVSKFDASGRLIRTIGVASHITGCCDINYLEPSGRIAADSSGNLYFAGTSCSAVHEEEYGYTIGGDCVYVVSKRSATGALQWQRTSPVGAVSDLTLTSSGSVYVVGSIGMARYSSSGGLLWTKKGTAYAVSQYSKIVPSGSNLYVRNLKDIRKYDANGKLLWTKPQSGLTTLVLQDMVADGSGNVYISGKYAASTGNMSAFARKLNSSGTVLWTKTYGTTAYDDALGIATITGSEIYTTGETQGSLAHTNIGGRDGYLRKLNSLGNPLWTK